MCIDFYAMLELSPDPSIRKTWADLETGLDSSLSRSQSLIQAVTAKSQALMVLKSMETVSLEAAVQGFQRMRNKLEDVVAESESWVVEELYHDRLPADSDVQSNIQKRISLAQQPFTVKNMEELMSIFAHYEYLRKSAALKPWEERVQPEMEWWRLVTEGQQLFSASEAVLRTVGGTSQAESLREEVEHVQRESPATTEGVYNYLHLLLGALMQAERLKHEYLNTTASEQTITVLHELCRDVLNLSMVFAAFANEPLTELLSLNSVLNRPDSDPERLARQLHPALQRLLQTATVKLTDKVTFKWLKPALEKCGLLGLEGVQKRTNEALQELVERDDTSFESYQARRREIEACFQLTLDQMQSRYVALQQQSQETIERLEEELQDIREKVGEVCSLANSAATDLVEVEDTDLKEAGTALLSNVSASGSASDKIESFGEAIEALAGSFIAYQAKAAEEKLQITTHLLGNLQQQMDSVFPAAISLAENADKEELTAECRQTMRSDLAPQVLFSTQLHLISTVLVEAKTVLRSRTAAMDTTALLRKSKHILDTVVRNAEDLAKGTVDPANEKKSREALQKVTLAVGNMGLAEVLDAVIEALKVERLQVDIRYHEEFAVADVCESSLVPISPAKRLSSVPTSDQKLSIGFTHLRQRFKTLIELLEIRIDEEEFKRKTAFLEHYSSLDRLLQEQGILVWLLQQASQSYKQPLEPILAASLDTLEAVAELIEDPGDKQDVQAAAFSTREESKQPTRPLRELVLDVQELAQAKLRLLSRKSAEPGAPSVLKGIERLMSVYDAELLTHGIKITITQDDINILQGNDEQQMALTRLNIMERALRALAEKAAVQKQEVRENKDYVVRSSRTIYATVMEALEIVSIEDVNEMKEGEDRLENQLQMIETATVRLRTILEELYKELEERNGPSTPPDICSQLFLQPAASEVSAPPEPQRTKLQGFPPKASPYSQLDKTATEAGNSLLHLLDLQGLKDLQAAGGRRLSVPIASGDALAIIGDKLSFIKEAGAYMDTNYWKIVGTSLVPLFESAKKNLNTARNLLKTGEKKEELWTLVSQLANRVTTNKEEVKNCLETAEATMQRVLAELVQDVGGQFEAAEGDVSAEPVETRKKLSALPSATDKVSTGMEFLMRQTGHILSSLSLTPAEETIEQLQKISTQTGQDKVLLQQAVLHSELKTINEAITTAFKPLAEQLLRDVRLVARYQDNTEEIETIVLDIETGIGGNGVCMTLLGDTIAILDAQLQDLGVKSADYEEFAATNAEIHSQSRPPLLRSRLMALPTAAERLSKGMDFLLREIDTLSGSLSLPTDKDRPVQTQKINEAEGQDQLLLQQALIHSLLKRTSVQLASFLRENHRKLQGMIRILVNSKGCGRKIDPKMVEIEQAVEADGLESKHLLSLLELLDRAVMEPSTGVEYEETTAEVQSTPAEELRSRLAAGNTCRDRLGKGLDFVIKQEMDLMELLGLLQEREYGEMYEACNAAVGEERLILQQNLLYKGLKAAYMQVKTSVDVGLEQAFAVSDHLAGFLAPGSPKTSFQEAIGGIKQEKGVYGGRMPQLSALLEQLSGLRSHISPIVSGVRPPKSGPSPWETMCQLLSQLGSYMGRQVMKSAADSKDLPSLCQSELSGCLMDLKSVVGAALQGLIAHGKYLDTFVPAGEAKQRSVAAFSELEAALRSPTAPRLPLLPTALQHLTTQQVLITPFTEDYTETTSEANTYEAEEIEGPGTKLACRPHAVYRRSRRQKLSSVPTAGDRLDKGMMFILKELGTLVEILQAPPGEDVSAMTSQAEEAGGQDKVLLRQGIVHSELKRLVGLLQTRLSTLHCRLVTILSNFKFSEEQSSILYTLQSKSPPIFSDLEEEEALLETALAQMGSYEEGVVSEEVVFREPERTRLSAVPNSGDKVGKGMDLLLRLTGQIYHKMLGEPAGYMETDLQRIHSATGQDKVLLQQALLHKELKDVLQTAETASQEVYEEIEEVKVESAEGERVKLQSGNTEGNNLFEEPFRASLETMAAFRVFFNAETQAEIEKSKTASPGEKAAIQRKVILLSLASLRAQAEALKAAEQDDSATSSLLTRLKVSLESFLGTEFTAEWSTVANASVSMKLRVIANNVDKFGSQLKRQSVERPSEVTVVDPAQVLLPYLQQSTSTEVSTRLSTGNIIGAAEECLRIWLTDTQETITRLSPYISASSEMSFSRVILNLEGELISLCEIAEVREEKQKLVVVRNSLQTYKAKSSNMESNLQTLVTEIDAKGKKTTTTIRRKSREAKQ
jgi:hypothetical protein